MKSNASAVPLQQTVCYMARRVHKPTSGRYWDARWGGVRGWSGFSRMRSARAALVKGGFIDDAQRERSNGLRRVPCVDLGRAPWRWALVRVGQALSPRSGSAEGTGAGRARPGESPSSIMRSYREAFAGRHTQNPRTCAFTPRCQISPAAVGAPLGRGAPELPGLWDHLAIAVGAAATCDLSSARPAMYGMPGNAQGIVTMWLQSSVASSTSASRWRVR